MPSAIFEVDTFVQKELLCFIGAGEYELLAGAAHDAVLHLTKLEFENLFEVIFLEAPKNHHLVDTVHKLRGELPLGRLRRSAIDLLIDIVLQHSFASSRSEPYRSGDQLAHLLRAKIRREEDHASREINLAVIAQS